MKLKNKYYVTLYKVNKLTKHEMESWIIITTPHDLYTSTGVLALIKELDELYCDFGIVIRNWIKLESTSGDDNEIG